MKRRFFILHSLHLAGLILLILGIGVWFITPANAQVTTYHYTEDWTPVEFRAVQLEMLNHTSGAWNVTAANPTSNWICLGPSKWNVSIKVYDDTNFQVSQIDEVWEAEPASWVDTQDLYGVTYAFGGVARDQIHVAYGLASTCSSLNGQQYTVDWRIVGGASNGLNLYYEYLLIHPTGLYGALVTDGSSNNDFKLGNLLYKTGIRSFPTKWVITDTITPTT